MKCPIIYMVKSREIVQITADVGDCLQEKCAWWDKEIEQCSINGLEPALEHIALSLRDIAKKVYGVA